MLRSRVIKKGRRGVIGAWLVLAMLSLIGMAALVIDLGRLTIAAQHLQNVVDAAALAGAIELPDTTAASTRLQGIIQVNNQVTPAFTVGLSPAEDITYYVPNDEVPEYGTLGAQEHAVEVAASTIVDYTFARMFGINQVQVQRAATALTRAGGGSGSGGIFFAAEDASHLWGVVINGSHQFVGGDIHSNTRVVINGSHQTVDGMIRYRHLCTINGAHNEIGDQTEGEIEPYPINYEWDHYYHGGPYNHVHGNVDINGPNYVLPSGHWKVNGDLNINGPGAAMANSTFMITGDLHINSAHLSASNCLFMVEGSIFVNGAHIDFEECSFIAKQNIYFNSALKELSFNRNCDGLFAMALGPAGVTYNGAWQRTEGIIFAPNGPITYNGAHQEVYNGGLAARTITVNGAHGSFNPLDEYGWGGESARPVMLIR